MKYTSRRRTLSGSHTPHYGRKSVMHIKATENKKDSEFRTIFVSAVGLGAIGSAFGLPGIAIGSLVGGLIGKAAKGQSK